MNQSGIRDNHNRGSVGEFLKDKIQAGSKLSFVSAYFTIYAHHALPPAVPTSSPSSGRRDGCEYLSGQNNPPLYSREVSGMGQSTHFGKTWV